jgi:hypothetical protein
MRAAQVVITSYDMMMRLTCEACCAGGRSAGSGAGSAGSGCKGAGQCMSAMGFKARALERPSSLFCMQNKCQGMSSVLGWTLQAARRPL